MLIQKDCIEGLKELDDNSVNCIVTSPPYNKKGLQGKATTKTKKQVQEFVDMNFEKKTNFFWKKI